MKTSLKQNEKIVKKGGGNLIQNGVGAGGKLILTNQRIIFEAHKLNIESISAEVELSNIQSLEKNWSKILGIPIINNELTVRTKNTEKYQFILFGRDAWILAIDALRADSTSKAIKTLDVIAHKPTENESSEVVDEKKMMLVIRQFANKMIRKYLKNFKGMRSIQVFFVSCVGMMV